MGRHDQAERRKLRRQRAAQEFQPGSGTTVSDVAGVFVDARRRIEQLYVDLQRLVDRDPDQEVWGDVMPVLDAVVQVVRDALPDDPVLRAVGSFYTARATSESELRAAEALLVVGSVRGAIPPAPPFVPTRIR